MQAPAYSHDPIQPLVQSIYWVQGSIHLGPGLRMNRNMVIAVHAGELVLINPVRLDEAGLNALEQLGRVKHIIRLGDFHGLDDAFYLERYQAQFWCQAGQVTYPEPRSDYVFDETTQPPIPDARFVIFKQAKYPEAALWLRESQLLVTTDSVQYWENWKYTSPITKVVLKLMGFRLGLQIGKPWLRRNYAKPVQAQADFSQLLSLDFQHLVAAHGQPLMHNAKQQVQQAITATFTK